MGVLSFVRYALYVAFPIFQSSINNLKKGIPIQLNYDESVFFWTLELFVVSQSIFEKAISRENPLFMQSLEKLHIFWLPFPIEKRANFNGIHTALISNLSSRNPYFKGFWVKKYTQKVLNFRKRLYCYSLSFVLNIPFSDVKSTC